MGSHTHFGGEFLINPSTGNLLWRSHWNAAGLQDKEGPHSDMARFIEPRSMFETPLEYFARVYPVSNTLGTMYKRHKLDALDQMRARRVASRRPERISTTEIILGNYDVANEAFPVIFQGDTSLLKISRADARTLFENLHAAVIEGWSEEQHPGAPRSYVSLVLTHPLTGQRYPISAQWDWTEETAAPLLPPNVAITHKAWADSDGDGNITLGEVESWPTNPIDGLPYMARRLHGREQLPEVWGD